MDHIEGLGDQALGSADAHGTAGLLDQSVGADQHADGGAVDVGELGQIDDEFVGSGVDQFLDGGFDGEQSIAETEAAADGEDGDAGLDSMSSGLVYHGTILLP